MEREVAPPGVKHGGDAQQPSETLRVEAELDERGARRREHRVEDETSIELGDGAQLRGQCEDHVKVRDWQQTLAARLDPACLRQGLALRAVTVATRVVAGLLVAAARAHVQVPPERRRPAALDGAQGRVLLGGQDARVAQRLTVQANDVRQLHGGTRHCVRAARRAG